MNDKAKEKFGYAIDSGLLPISEGLKHEINILEKEHGTYLNWDCPQDPSTWFEEHKEDFCARSTAVYEKLKTELGSRFNLVNEVRNSID